MIRAAFILALGATGCAQIIGFDDPGELRLDNLEVSTGALVPAFDPAVTSYSIALPYVGPALTVTPSADASVELTVDGAAAQMNTAQTFDVAVGDRSIAFVLRTTSGVERTYTIAIHRADLDLSFGGLQTVFAINSIYAVQRADVNADGVDDLVYTDVQGTIGTSVNDGTGLFTTSSSAWISGLNPRAIAVADVSGDGIGDLLVANGGLQIGNGNGDGTYAAMTDVGAFTDVSAVSVGRVDADALDDVVAGNGAGFVTPVFGRAAGPTKGSDWPITQIIGEPRIVRVARIEGPKLVSLDSTEHVIIVSSTTDPSLRWPYPLDSRAYPSDMLVADFDGDGHDDIAFLDQITGVVSVLTKFPNWEHTNITVSGNPRSLVIGDFDADGHPDLAMTAGSELVVLRNDGSAKFEQRRFGGMPSWPSSLAVGDFNHDGRDDVIFAEGTPTMTMAFGGSHP
ncbi:MAG TPA: FG-GAP-like repeat-containing protein [Kofleriaceae bacterium]